MSTTLNAGLRLRRAQPSDVAELIRLRHVLLRKPGAYYATDDPGAHEQWERCFADWLPTACCCDTVHVAVIETLDGSALAACGIGVIDARPPGPGLLNGRCGWIQSVVTDPAWRSKGLASRVIDSLMDWFVGAGVARVILHTTSEAQQVYLRRGFEHCGEDALVALSITSAPLPAAENF